MEYLAIDLAERHTAAVMLNEDLDVTGEWAIDTGKAEKQEHPWKRMLRYRNWLTGEVLAWTEDPFVYCVEDLRIVIEEPYPHAINVAPSFRMQGGILASLQDLGLVEEQVRITKSMPWQNYFGYTKKEFGNSKAWAKHICAEFGYEPGERTGQKFLAKPKEDLRDSYLLARWLKETT